MQEDIAEVTVVPSICWECSNLCGSLVSIKAGEVVKIARNLDHIGSKGALFMKVIPDPAGPGQESVWSYPRPAVTEPSQGRLKIVHLDDIIAKTQKGILARLWHNSSVQRAE